MWLTKKDFRKLMSTIQDLTTSVNGLTAAVAAVPQGGGSTGGTVLTAADQAELDNNVAAITAATATLTGDVAVVPVSSGLPGMVTGA